jgi:hypothetical protein
LQLAHAAGGFFPSASHRYPHRSHLHRHPSTNRRLFPIRRTAYYFGSDFASSKRR